MSRQPENTFIASVHRHLPVELYRMKNHNQYNGGIPDVWYSGPAGDLWIEYKFVILPKRDSTVVGIELSELQKNWLRSRHAEGRKVGVIIGCPHGGAWLPGTDWDCLYSTLDFRALIKSRQDLAATIIKIVA
jgi:hypothetical protein